MLKYIKTLHSHTVAETLRCPARSDTYYKKGTICQFDMSGRLDNANEPNRAKYLVLESRVPDEGIDFIDCIRLLPGMMLTATADFDTSSIPVGSFCGFATDSDDRVSCVSEYGDDAEIIGIDGKIATIIINK
ncbi:MAG: hypothetical protein IKY62_06185 [Clostridia bacterium]|nr:hypothetical protein [Clostridia bacterium]